MHTFTIRDTVVAVREHGADVDPADEDALAMLRAFATPRVYVSASSRRSSAVNRAYASVWRAEGPDVARRISDAGWELPSRARILQPVSETSAETLVVEARWVSLTVAVLVVLRRPALDPSVELRSSTPWQAWNCLGEDLTPFHVLTA